MHTEGNPKFEKILLVRNDNIGDLICSIPAIQLIREHCAAAQIHLLVNSYNAPAVEALVPGWVDRLVVYRKTKHVGFNLHQLAYLIRFYRNLRREGYDAVVLLVGGRSRQSESFARWSGAEYVLGYGLDHGSPQFQEGHHELEYSWDLANRLCGIKKDSPVQIEYPIRATGLRTAIQITSRKPGNRWEAQQFAELAQQIHAHKMGKPLLLWSPGNSNTLTHPGDDDKAADILGLASIAVEPRPTATLQDLISVLQECRSLITPDGGAMHLAAAMGVRIVAMFGQSDPIRWRPWTPHARILQSPSHTIQDIKVKEAVNAWLELNG